MTAGGTIVEADNSRLPRHIARYLLGLVFLLAALSAAVMLVVQHLGHLELPGCAPGSGCAALAAGPWGRLFGLPVSFLGTAYFAALAVFWLWAGCRDAVSGWLKWGVRLGVAGSLFFVGVMLFEQHFCQYCLVVHLGNLAFWIVLECSRRAADAPFPVPAAMGAVVFAAVMLVLVNVEGKVEDVAKEKQEQQLQRSIEQIGAHVRSARVPPDDGTPPFTGRWLQGPERAAIRIVVFSDYQCKDCRKTEGELEDLLAGRKDVSYSHMHYPLCMDCNRYIKIRPFHEQACRAARAAEAAGILGGNDGFWKMHEWVFERKAKFSDKELRAALPGLGFEDPDRFLEVMDGPETLRPIREDVQRAAKLGITGTPMVFFNGVELQGNEAERAIQRAVEVVMAENPTPRTAAADRPEPGIDRLFASWRDGDLVKLPKTPARWTLGPANAPLRVQLIVCHQNPYSVEFCRNLREAAAQRDDVQIELWHFPISKQHNPALAKMKKDRFPEAYQMALAAEAAGRVGGQQAFWKMHDWLLDHQTDFSIESADEAAAAMGIDPERFAAEVDNEATAAAVDADIAALIEVEVKWCPEVYIGGRDVPGVAPSVALLMRLLAASAGR